MLTLASLAGFLWWDNDSVQTEYFEYDSRRLPRSFDAYRIAVLSDLHDKSFGEGNRRLMSAVNAVQPDLIAVTGDLVDRFRGMDPDYIQTTAAGLREIAPVYYVTGNHEWALGGVPELKQMLSDSGWTVLSNEYVTLKNDGESIVLAGIDDPNGHADQKTPEELAEELHTECGDPYWILLAHRNDRFEDQYSLLGADLTLSGHGHGGMVRLPFTDGLIGTQRNWFPSYTAGFYTAHGSTVFVSRGLGNSGASFRLFNRPQVAVVTLGCKK
jgi:predicted MPP superfamily phosphohydrolase